MRRMIGLQEQLQISYFASIRFGYALIGKGAAIFNHSMQQPDPERIGALEHF